MEENQQDPAPKQETPTPAEFYSKAVEYSHNIWTQHVDSARIAIARRMQPELFNDPSLTPNMDEIRAMVPLEGDTMRYATDIKGVKCPPRVAVNRHGMISFPKGGNGRRKPHMTLQHQAIKSTSLRIFGNLFKIRSAKLETEAKANGQDYVGIPKDDLTKLAAKASVLGTATVKTERKARKQRARRRGKLSRLINGGARPGNSNVRRYIG